ncbi:helix-turn-helix domain-containing protein [Pseudomonas juntendi]|uniref:Helix-turn-helix domain-containing protein n=1 Tax=Pseudomonas juntendi TaxID=2666183 RepID=A0A7W2KC48_9PSED|nr:S24 family peptidase [Pseudomonas juntendi]MBA6095617.1 helix-turn-helix domain-containing protein [Pseudomonas juntendi]
MIGNRVAKRMHELGLSGGELARRSGVPQPTIHRILSGTSASPRHENVERIAKALGVTTDWLWKGEGSSQPPLGPTANVEPGPKVRGFVPLISWVQAGAWCEMQEPFELEAAEAWLPCAVSHSSSTFALRVRGLSMFNPHERRSFREGDIIFVDPARDYENGSLVIVKLANSKEATFKQLVAEGERYFLKPLNPSWPDPIIELPSDATICGVVVSKVEIF